MSQQEEDKKKCGPSGKALAVGLAATALGVGIGTALYYFFNKDEENNVAGGSSDWEQHQQAFFLTHNDEDTDADSYSTISAHTTTDTSLNDDDPPHPNSNSSACSSVDSSLDRSNTSNDISNDSHQSSMEVDYTDLSIDSNESSAHSSAESNSDWDVTDTLDIPNYIRQIRSPFKYLLDSVLPATPLWSRRNRANRARANTLEECTICFEVMLHNEELMGLPCTHNFHVKCIAPWLLEHQTCPVCRSQAE